MGIFDSIDSILEAPEHLINSGENALDNLIDLPNKILQMIEAMEIPMLMIGGIVLLKTITE